MEIYVIRHTPTTAAEGICYGQSDLPLQEPFDELFNTIKKTLPEHDYIVYSSPLTRCHQLAQHLSDGTTVTCDDRLKEIDFGLWENETWDSIKKEDLTNWMTDFVNTGAPNGESFNTLHLRVISFLEELLLNHSEDQKIIIVSHAGVIRSILSYLLATPLTHAFKIPVAFGSITKMTLHKDDAWNKLIYLNKETAR